MDIPNIYEWKHYKKLLIIPIILTIISFFYVFHIKTGIEFSGGTLITAPISKDIDVNKLKREILNSYNLVELDVRQTGSQLARGIYIQFAGERSLIAARDAFNRGDFATTIQICKAFTGELNVSGNSSEVAATYFSNANEKFKNSLIAFISEKTGTPISDFSIRDVGPSLGALFWEQAKNAIILAFIFIIVLVFLFFREAIVSLAVIQAAFFDVLIAAAFIAFMDMPLSLVTIAPLLMLIGYSVDSDIMLTDRILKRKTGTIYERAKSAFKTGITMTGTTIGAVSSLYLISTAVGIEVLSNISMILLVGLFADLISTWITNVSLVLWAAERKLKKKGRL